MVKANAKKQLRFVLALFMNAAPVIPKPKTDEEKAFNRETQPWYVLFPQDKLAFMLRDPRTGIPVTGDQVSPQYVMEIATALYNVATKDSKSLEEAQANYEYPDVVDRGCRVHPRTILVAA